MANTAWNPADKTATVTLSLANLRATTGATAGGARGTGSLTAGQYYWENTYTTISTNGEAVGIALASVNLANVTTGAAWVNRLGAIFNNNTNTGSSLGTISSGGVIGIAVDFTGRLIWFRVAPAGNWNGSGTANPATATGGINISAISTGPLYALMSGNTGDAITANFGDSAFSGAVPAGFTAGFPVGGGAATAQARVMVLA